MKKLSYIYLLLSLNIIFGDPNLFYWKPSQDEDNFGDALSPLIVEKIVGRPLNTESSNQQLVAIGSILHFARNNDIIWGSGVHEDNLQGLKKISSLNVRAVRGPLTRKYLIDKKIPCPEIYGDPALLLQTLFPELKPNPILDYIVIPNLREISQYEGLPNLVLPTENYMEIIQKILEAKLVISGSLHGIIVAESFGIPAIFLRLTQIPPLSKYQDYYEGTGRKTFPIAYSLEEAFTLEPAPPPKCDLIKLLESFPLDKFLSPSELLIRNLVDVNYQKTVNPKVYELFKTEETFFKNLYNEVIEIVEKFNPSIVTNKKHLSNWSSPEGIITQYSLLNESGKFDDYSSDHNRSINKKIFSQEASYPNLKALIKSMPHATNFRINILYPKSCFTQHREDLCFIHKITKKPALRVRFHLPIFTNNHSKMLLNGDLYHFEAGKIYFFHNGAIHDGINQDDSLPRIHLLWDMLLTEDTYKRMFERSIDIPFLKKSKNIKLEAIDSIEIDPNYKKVPHKIPYQEALKITFCPVQ